MTLLTAVYESNPWENLWIHPSTSKFVTDKLDKSLKGFLECSPRAREVVTELFFLTMWHKEGTKFGPDTLEIISELENDNLSSQVKEYIEKLCTQLGGN